MASKWDLNGRYYLYKRSKNKNHNWYFWLGERKVKQEVSIDMEFPFDCKRAAKTDSIEDTVDYKTICKGVIKFVEESSFQLQESLAEGIASLVKDTYGVESIKLRVSKPGALRGAKDVGLIIHR